MNDMYNTYDDCKVDYYQKDIKIKYKPKATWAYGDTVSITFNLNDCDCTIALEDLTGKQIFVQFYNFRFEELPIQYIFESNQEVVDNNYDFSFDISREDSINYFKPGTYYCSISLITFNNEEEIDECYTILNKNKCCFYVN